MTDSPPDLPSRIASVLAEAKRKALIEGRQLYVKDVAGIIRGAFPLLLEGPAQKKDAPIPRKRNTLLDALVEACGGDPATTTKTAFRSAANALSEIKTVCPTITPDEIVNRAQRYQREHRDWTLTPTSLAKWWAHLGGGPRTKSEKNDIYIEPHGWRSVLQNLYDLSDDGIRDKQWLDISPDTRRQVLNQMKSA